MNCQQVALVGLAVCVGMYPLSLIIAGSQLPLLKLLEPWLLYRIGGRGAALSLCNTAQLHLSDSVAWICSFNLSWLLLMSLIGRTQREQLGFGGWSLLHYSGERLLGSRETWVRIWLFFISIVMTWLRDMVGFPSRTGPVSCWGVILQDYSFLPWCSWKSTIITRDGNSEVSSPWIKA